MLTDSEPDQGLVDSAGNGDRAALVRLATWYRARGRTAGDVFGDDSDQQVAYRLEAYSFEVQERHLQARKLRRLLSLLPRDRPAFSPTRHARLQDLRDHASAFGLPVEVFPAQWVPAEQPPPSPEGKGLFCPVPLWGGSIDDRNAQFYLVVCPTDGEAEAETSAAVRAFFAQHFSGLWPIEVRHWNRALTAAGDSAEGDLGLRE